MTATDGLPLVDHCAYTGPYARRPIGVEADALAATLAPLGATRVYASRLESLWYENPHDANRLGRPRPADARGPEVIAVPVLDPTVATWREELDRCASAGRLAMVRLHPNYHRYTLIQADALLDALARRRLVAHVVARVDDPRRHHPLARVSDVAAGEVRDAASRHPTLRILVSGLMTPTLAALGRDLPPAGNLWAETAQLDGVDALRSLMASPWRDRLVFGTNAPLFVPQAALARVLTDLDDAPARAVLVENHKGLGT